MTQLDKTIREECKDYHQFIEVGGNCVICGKSSVTTTKLPETTREKFFEFCFWEGKLTGDVASTYWQWIEDNVISQTKSKIVEQIENVISDEFWKVNDVEENMEVNQKIIKIRNDIQKRIIAIKNSRN